MNIKVGGEEEEEAEAAAAAATPSCLSAGGAQAHSIACMATV
jgi:hypothetical protein